MKLLTHILIIYFVIGACVPRSDFSQLSQVNNLLDHYKLHQLEAEALAVKISFVEFLYLHFVSGDEHQHSNGDEHDGLPLYSLLSGILLYVKKTSHVLKTCFTVALEKEIFFQDTFYLNPFIHQVFHPPVCFID